MCRTNGRYVGNVAGCESWTLGKKYEILNQEIVFFYILLGVRFGGRWQYAVLWQQGWYFELRWRDIRLQ